MKLIVMLCVLCFISIAYEKNNKFSPPIVKIQEGQVKGKLAQDFLGVTFYSFLGIPYGKAPTGDLRFKAPLPVEPWEDIRDATKEGPECPSRHLLFTYYVGSEDNCLNLNVYTRELPDEVSNSFKPVMVWIHGGAFLYGSNKSDTLYGPDYLMQEDIVLVCLNYRLGVLGFLSLEDPTLEIPGNAGLKDIILALKWVQKNIRKFSGDPHNVTIFGESAGSAAVHYLCLSPMSKGLFHKAIAQSGTSLNNWARGCSNGLLISEKLGFTSTNEKEILEYLRSLPPRRIVEGQHKIPDPFDARTVRPFGPVVEKNSTESTFLSEEPLQIIKSGSFNHVPLIMGYTSREGIFCKMMKTAQLTLGFEASTSFEQEIFHDVNLEMGSEESKKIAKTIKEYYYDNEEPSESNTDKQHLLRTDNLFLYGIHKSVSQQKLVTKAPIYFYKLTLDSSLNYSKKLNATKNIYLLIALCFLMYKSGDGIIKNTLFRLVKLLPTEAYFGTCHGDDLTYLFKSFFSEKLISGSTEETYVKRFVKMWANFARTGNPTPDKDDTLLKVQWIPVTKEENYLLDIGSELTMRNDPDGERIKFWNDLFG